jgi:DNA-directed RNA polymerase subunit beta'
MALELFKPFIMAQLVERKAAQNIKAAKKMVDSMIPEVWDVLEQVIHEHPVLLNRAPTLHRLGIQAFEPVLVEGKAIQVHPLVCHAFNADFDGDQMAVHLPLSAEAQAEARILMLSSNNILSPAHGAPLATPTQDMVLGAYYLTYGPESDDLAAKQEALTSGNWPSSDPRPKVFRTAQEAELSYELGNVKLHDVAEYRPVGREGGHVLTTVGRIIYNDRIERALEEAMSEAFDVNDYVFINQAMRKRDTVKVIDALVQKYGASAISLVLDAFKDLGFKYATQAGITISKNDVVIPPKKGEILAKYEAEVSEIQGQYDMGLITQEERHELVVEKWTAATDEVASAMQDHFDRENPIFMMAESGARGSLSQIRQLAGMRGLMANPKGEIIERPIKANFMEGLTVLEYFISTHGARKGLADTALRTADSGYLTRRLVDVAQDVIIREPDCGTKEYIELPVRNVQGDPNDNLVGRYAAEEIATKRSRVIVEKGGLIDREEMADIFESLDEDAWVAVRSVLKCEAVTGVCQACYGRSMATGQTAQIGDAVGIIAAQSIGEPGTQLTMRTFHTGGVAGADITHGLPRVVEIFEARNPKGAATLAEVGGRIEIEEADRTVKITIEPDALDEAGEPIPAKEYALPRRSRLLVTQGQVVEQGDALNEGSRSPAELLDLHARAGKGSTETELYLVGEVQKVYKSQGVDIHDKHIELIVRQMLKKVRVMEAGDTILLPGELADKTKLERENAKLKKKDEQATFEPLILGITKASLATESFLSAASFQETTKVLTDAAIEGTVDHLRGLKENVIIGKLIPAATGLKRYRQIGIGPSDSVPAHLYARPETEAELLAALEEIGGDGDGLDLEALGLTFGGTPGSDEVSSHDAGEATEVPEVESPLDEEK